MGCCKMSNSVMKQCQPIRKVSYDVININNPFYVNVEIKGLLTKEQLEKSKLIKL